MITATVVSSLCVFLMRPTGFDFGIAGVAFDERHYHDAGLETRHSQRQFRKQQQRRQHHAQNVGMRSKERVFPGGPVPRLDRDVIQTDADNGGVKRQKRDHQNHGDADGFFETFQKNGGQNGDQS